MNNITRDQPVKLICLVSYVYLFWSSLAARYISNSECCQRKHITEPSNQSIKASHDKFCIQINNTIQAIFHCMSSIFPNMLYIQYIIYSELLQVYTTNL